MATARPNPIRGAIGAHLASRDATRVIYGAIVGLAVVVALQNHPPPVGTTIAAIAGTALAVALAEMYSEAVGAEARTRQRLNRADLRRFAGESASVAFGAGFPVIFFVLAAAGAMKVATAFTLAKWTGLALICGYGLLAARLSGAGWHRSFAEATAVGLIGGLLIGLKALVH